MLTPEQIAALRAEPLDGRNKVKQARTLLGVTQVELATRVGHSQPYISSIELGQYSVDALPLETTRRLAGFFGCAIEDLFPAPAAVGR